ncbi:patatin-like phospholipase family protein [Chitinispirillales bacterium ANBcel5]|uniref:patatin-like phospholipase family protein n=1 Tax=Cellulosispirillum alkaliphilum TaxID=3039283 RepID=UPI002A5305CE|nr:patatin-like phospholipase family protein [Chitinispirillales bacterium ANBcel5]
MKKPQRIVTGCLLLLLFSAYLFSPNAKYRFALVLSGGGARGVAQIGVLKALQEAGVKPDLIVASSMGSVIGSLYASGYELSEIKSLIKNINWEAFLKNRSKRQNLFVNQKTSHVNYLFEIRFDNNFRPILPNSISHGQAFYNHLSPKLLSPQFMASNDFSKLPVSLRIVSTDILTGNKYVFSEGNLISAVRASCAVPLAFSPVQKGEKLLIDGGISSNIPVETARDEGAQFVVAIDVTSSLWGREDLDNPIRIVDQIVAIGIEKNKRLEIDMADIVIRPELDGFTNLNFNNLDTLIEIGYAATKEQLPQIVQKLQKLYNDNQRKNKSYTVRVRVLDINGEKIAETYMDTLDSCHNILSSLSSKLPRELSEFKTIKSDLFCENSSIRTITVKPTRITEVVFQGAKRTNPQFLTTASGLDTGMTLSEELIGSSTESLYSTDLFETVNIDIDDQARLSVVLQEKKYLRLRSGLRYDEFHRLEGYIHPAYENIWGTGITSSLYLQYGLRREKYAVDLQGNYLFTSDFANNILLKGYISKERVYDRDSISKETLFLRKTGFMASGGAQILKSLSFTSGIKYELFDLRNRNRSLLDDGVGFRFNRSVPYFLLRFIYDTIDEKPFPRNGWNHTIALTSALKPLPGSEDFLKIDGSSGLYFTLGNSHTIHSRFTWAWSNSTLPEVERVYLGGSFQEHGYKDIDMYNNIPFKGLSTRSLTGDILASLHLDYSFRINTNLLLTFDLDWGRVWKRDADFVTRKLPSEFLYQSLLGSGVGVVYKTIFGPISISYGNLIVASEHFNLNREHQFYFSLGHDF